jgi:transposase InsO family protein
LSEGKGSPKLRGANQTPSGDHAARRIRFTAKERYARRLPKGRKAKNPGVREAPFPIRGVQVDGGAEFKPVFEAECQARGLELFALPRKRPDLKGCVECTQSTWRYAFCATYDLPPHIDKLQPFAGAFTHRENHHRPHEALGGRTPAEYL